jgi:tetratricopeptide (TPR) repeat protein
MHRLLSVLLLVLLAAGAARAEGAAPTVPGIAARVVEASASGDRAALKALAAGRNPDPWLVVDHLLSTGRRDAALAFAGEAGGPEVEGLAAWLAAAPTEGDLEGDRAALAAASAALERRDADGALAALEGHPAVERGIVAVRLLRLRGAAQEAARQYEDAAATQAAAADLAEAIGWRAEASSALSDAGGALWMLRDYDGMRVHYWRRLAVETALGSVAGMGRANFQIGATYMGQARYEEQVPYDEKARKLAEEAGDHQYVAKVLFQDAFAWMRRKHDPEQALRVMDEVVAALDRVDGSGLAARFQPDPAAVAGSRVRTLLQMSVLWSSLSDVAKANDYGNRAIASARAFEGRSGPLLDEALAQNALRQGDWLEREGKPLQAIGKYTGALRIFRRTRNRVKIASSLERLGSLNTQVGDFTKAVAMLREALQIHERVGARYHLCRTKGALGLVLLSQGRLREAEHQLDAALELARVLKDKGMEAHALVDLARCHREAGRPARAMELVRQALGHHVADASLPNHGSALLLLGQIYVDIKEPEPALRAMESAEEKFEAAGDLRRLEDGRRARAILLATQGGDPEAAVAILKGVLAGRRARTSRTGIASALMDLANVQFLGRRYAEAAETRREALGLFEQTDDPIRSAGARVQLGRDLFFAGARDEALAELDGASALAEELGDPIVTAWASLALVEARFFSKDHAGVFQAAEQGLEALATYGLSLSDEQAAAQRARFAAIPKLALAAAIDAKDVERAFRYFEKSRGQALLAALGGAKAIREATVPAGLLEEQNLAREAVNVAQAELEEALGSNDLPRRTKLHRALKAARLALDETNKAVRMAARAQVDLGITDPGTFAAFQKTLADGEVFIGFTEVQGEALALTATRDDHAVRSLGKMDDLTALVTRMLPGKPLYVDPGAVVAVRKALLDPLKLPAGARRLLIAPDSRFAYVPFCLLDERRSVAIVPSATSYGMLRRVPATHSRQVLALGDPVYEIAAAGTPGGTRGGPREALPRIDKTGDEVRRVGDTKLLREEATLANLRKNLESAGPWRSVHIACHGHVDLRKATMSWLAFSPATTGGEKAPSVDYVWAADVKDLAVTADMVVLSGCETGLGHHTVGEGLIGLVRSFMLSGAPRVLASLWKVDDAATLELMTKFYEYWNPKDGTPALPAPVALRKAQAHVRDFTDETGAKPWSHPRFWAAWVIWGRPD